jgi:hypothetical protein
MNGLNLFKRLSQPKADFRAKKRKRSIWWCVKGVIYWEPLLGKNTFWTWKVESEVVKQGLSSGKIYFKRDKAKTHVAKFV